MSTNNNLDTNPMPPLEYDQSKVPDLSRKHADYVRTKTYGHDVRESLARGVEYAGLVANSSVSSSRSAEAIAKDIAKRFDQQIAGTTNSQEVIDARGSYPLLNARLNAMDAAISGLDGVVGDIDFSEEIATIKNEILKTASVINLESYGIVYDDPTFDNKPLLQKAMKEHAYKSILYLPNKGDVYVSENLYLESGTHLIGGSGLTTIKLMPTVKNYWTMLHADTKHDIIIENIRVYSNHEERRAKGNIGDLASTNSAQMGLSMGGESENIHVNNCEFDTNGTWIIACHTGGVHPKNIRVTKSKLKWTMGFATPDKPFAQGVTVDNTLVYFDAVGYEFTDNIVETGTGYANMTGIEAHGKDGKVTHNIFRGVRTGAIGWNMVNDSEGKEVINNIIIENNLFENVLNGVDIGLSPTRNFNNLSVSNNIIKLAPSKFPGAVASRGVIIGVWSATNGEINRNLKVEGNDISCEDFTIVHNDTAIYYNYYGIGVISGVFENISIKNNKIHDMPSFGIIFQNEVNKTINIESGVLEHNQITNAAKSQQNRGNIPVSAIHIASNASVYTGRLAIGVNYIFDTRTNTTTHYSVPYTLPYNNFGYEVPKVLTKSITGVKYPGKSNNEIVFDTTKEETSIGAGVQTKEGYLRTFEIKLNVRESYVVQSNMPSNIYVSNADASRLYEMPAGVPIGTSSDSQGRVFITVRPEIDPDGTRWNPNEDRLKDKTYYVKVRKF